MDIFHCTSLLFVTSSTVSLHLVSHLSWLHGAGGKQDPQHDLHFLNGSNELLISILSFSQPVFECLLNARSMQDAVVGGGCQCAQALPE